MGKINALLSSKRKLSGEHRTSVEFTLPEDWDRGVQCKNHTDNGMQLHVSKRLAYCLRPVESQRKAESALNEEGRKQRRETNLQQFIMFK